MTVFVLSVVVAAQPQAFDLTWKPVKGQVAEYRYAARTVESDDKFEMEALIEHTVLNTGRDGYQIKSLTKGAILRTELGEIRDARQEPSTVKFAPNGAVTKVEKAQDRLATMRFLAFTRFVAPEKPVTIGEKWQHAYKASQGFGGASLDFTLESVKDGEAKVGYSLRETGRDPSAEGSGSFVIDLKDNSVKEVHAVIESWLVKAQKTEILMAREKT